MSTRPECVLLYRSTCGKCRVLSALIVCAALGSVRRVALDSPEALRLAVAHGLPRGKLVLVTPRRVSIGWRAGARTLALLPRTAWARLRRAR